MSEGLSLTQLLWQTAWYQHMLHYFRWTT